MNKLFLILMIIPLSIFPQTLNLSKGWDLLGAVEDISDLSVFFNEDCDKEIFAYRNNRYIDRFELIEIKKGEGFWTYSEKSCTINTNKNKIDLKYKTAKVYLVKAKDIPLTNIDGSTPDSNMVLERTVKYAYSKEIYEDYFDEMSFGKFKIDFTKGEVLEIDSYPIIKDEAKNKLYGFKIIDVFALSDMVNKLIPIEDRLKYDPIILHIGISEDTQYTSSGVAVSNESEVNGKTVVNNYFMFQFNNKGVSENIDALEQESIIGSTKATIIHELIHTFGFSRHANSLIDKKIVEYGNLFDVLGYGSLSINLNPGIRDYFNWLDESNTLYIDTNKPESKQMTLYPLNGKNGKRVVKIRVDKETSYYIYFLGDDKWSLLNLNKDIDYSTYTGFSPPLSEEILKENKKGIFILKENGVSNELFLTSDNNAMSVFRKNDTYENKFFKIDNINMSGNSGMINFNLVIK